jgi:hypothetical protein
MVDFSAAGLCFALDCDPGVGIGTLLVSVTVGFGSCLFEGDLRVTNTRPIVGSRLGFGCLFYPASDDDAGRWMALIAGAQAMRGG